MDSMFLTDEELTELTRCRTPWAHAKWLKTNRIPYVLRPDGSPVVHRDAVHRAAQTRSTWDDAFPSIWDMMMTKSLPRNPCGVYFLFQGKRVVYIGMSTNFFLRMSQHLSGDKEFDSVVFLPVPQDDVRHVEREMIARYQPPLNKTGIKMELDPEAM